VQPTGCQFILMLWQQYGTVLPSWVVAAGQYVWVGVWQQGSAFSRVCLFCVASLCLVPCSGTG